MKQRDGLPLNGLPIWVFTLSLLMGLGIASPLAWCQDAPSQPAAADTAALTSAVHDLQQQVQELRSAVAEMYSEAAQYRQQTDELRQELELTRQAAASSATPSRQTAAAPPALPQPQRILPQSNPRQTSQKLPSRSAWNPWKKQPGC